MNREEVYRALDTERDYQDRRWGDAASSGRPGNGDRTIDEFVMYVFGYAQDALKIASHELDPTKKMAALRKVGALCVAAGEQHGMPTREG